MGQGARHPGTTLEEKLAWYKDWGLSFDHAPPWFALFFFFREKGFPLVKTWTLPPSPLLPRSQPLLAVLG